MPTKNELSALLKEINTLKQGIERIERRVKAMLVEGERTDQRQQDLATTLDTIINRLEKDKGYAPIEIVIAQAVRAGFGKAEVEAELDRILR